MHFKKNLKPERRNPMASDNQQGERFTMDHHRQPFLNSANNQDGNSGAKQSAPCHCIVTEP
jgi:hypothetical protein